MITLYLIFKLLFGGSSSSYRSDNAIDDFLDDCDFDERHR